MKFDSKRALRHFAHKNQTLNLFKRRQFLQFTGSALAALGLSQLDIQSAGNRMARVLAQGTPRKLAFLVGINEYPHAPLRGCVTDVDLQRQLLIHRFGFNPKDILVLTDRQATRKGILEGFEEHLIKQARFGDIVVFHFSGHGSQVADADCDYPDCRNSTFVPIDSDLPAEFLEKGGFVEDIMGQTLFLLMSALQTENVTVVLDSCHSGGAKRDVGNLRVRSRTGAELQPKIQISPSEKAYQNQWLSRLNLSPEEFKQRRRASIAKGVVISSTKRDQLAADAPFSDFYAGAFTYLMSQYLWQQPGSDTFASAVPTIARNTTRLSFTRQVPEIEAKQGSTDTKQPVYFINEPTPPAEAVITKVEGTQTELWLGGLDPQSLVAFDKDAILMVVDSQGKEQGLLQLESRQGLIGRGKLLQPAKLGAFLQERTRGIPTNISLKIGLDSSLGNALNTAKQALQVIKHIEAVPLQQGEVQYILGRMTAADRQEFQKKTTNSPAVGSIGLYTPALEIIPDSFGAADETVTNAIGRLRAKLQSLLAARIVKLTLNTNSSRLNISASMRPEGGNKVVASSFTVRGSLGQGTVKNPQPLLSPNSQKLPLGTGVELEITNNETSDLYLGVLVIDPTGEITVIFPNQWTASDDAARVSAEKTLLIPDPNKDEFRLVTQEPKGVAEILIIASRTPLRTALQALRNLARDNSRGSQESQRSGPMTLNQPTEVVGKLLNDLNEGTRGSQGSNLGGNTVHSIDTTQLAAMSITFEVI